MGSTPEVVSVHISKVCLRLGVLTVLQGVNAYYLILIANFGAKNN